MTYGNARWPVLLAAMLSSTTAGANEIEDKFRLYDSNHDGAVSMTEHAAANANLFKEIDSNHDGRIDAGELTTSMVKATTAAYGPVDVGGMQAARIVGQTVVKAWDRDGNGTASPVEFKANADVYFARSDANHDGRTTLEEMQAGATPAVPPAR